MSIFPIHTAETAPEAARPLLDQAKARFGFVPNILSGLAESPAALEGYMTLMGLFHRGSFSEVERDLVLIAVSARNDCDYCVAAHSTQGASHGLSAEDLAAIRDHEPLSDPRLEALRRFVDALVEKRGWAGEDEIQAFLAAGFERAQALELLVAIAAKTLSNYANHMIGTPIDEQFAAQAATA